MARSGRCLGTPRAGVLLVLLLAAAVSLAKTAHWLSVPHRLCEVHGVLEHGVADGRDSSSPASASSPAPGGPHYQSTPSEHEDCECGPLARAEGALLTEPPRVSAPLPARHGFSPVRRERLGSIPLLFLAPKHSPPA